MPSKVCKTDYKGIKQHRHHRSKGGRTKKDPKEIKTPKYKNIIKKIKERESLEEFMEKVAYLRFKRIWQKSVDH